MSDRPTESARASERERARASERPSERESARESVCERERERAREREQERERECARARETYVVVESTGRKADPQKRPATVSKETYYRVKRDLLQCTYVVVESTGRKAESLGLIVHRLHDLLFFHFVYTFFEHTHVDLSWG